MSRGRVVDSAIMDPLEWVCKQGVVLQSARGPVPNLAEHVAGEPIRGSWWGHSSGHEIFAVLTRVLDSPDVIATRVVDGKVTLIHRRVWPALVRVADRFPLSVSPLSTRCTRHRVPTGRSRLPSPSGSPPKTSPPRRCSLPTRRSRCCPPAFADGRLVRHRSGQVPRTAPLMRRTSCETNGMPTASAYRLKRRDIAERFARRTHTLTGGAAFNTAEPARARPA